MVGIAGGVLLERALSTDTVVVASSTEEFEEEPGLLDEVPSDNETAKSVK